MAMTVLAAAGCGSSKPLGQRSPPAFVPKSSLRADGPIEATPARPALAVQGGAVVAHLPSATVHATVVGPLLPPKTTALSPPTVPGTWTVTLSAASASVPLAASQFSIKDSLGKIATPLAAPGSAPLPASIGPGQTVVYKVTEVIPVGEGLLMWAPTAGAPIASWDWIAETD